MVSGIVLILLVGVFAPASALLTGITDQLSFLFIGLAGFIWLLFILYRGCLAAGFASSVPALVSFNIGIPLSPWIGPTRVELLLVDFGLVLVAALSILLWHIESKSHILYLILPIFLFAVWSFISGIVAVLQGYPPTGIIFGINQFRYVLIAIATIGISLSFGHKPIMITLFTSISIHSINAIMQSLIGRPWGLPYYGDSGMSVANTEIGFGLLQFTTGLFPGGFVGSSRSLLAMLLIVFVPAIYYLSKGGFQAVPALVCIISTPLVVIASRSQNGLAVFIISCVIIVTVLLLIRCNKFISLATILAGTIIGFFLLWAFIWRILSLDLTSTSAIRYRQYIIAIETGFSHPGFGIGGMNFNWYTDLGLREGYEDVEEIYGVHNTFLAYFAELGLPGLLLYIISIFVPYYYCIKKFASTHSLLAGLFAIGMLNFHIFSNLAWVYHREVVIMTFWLVVTVASTSCLDMNNIKRRSKFTFEE